MPFCRRTGVATPLAPPCPVALVLCVLAFSAGSGPVRATPGSADLLPYHQLEPEPKVLALTPGLEGEAFASLLDRLEAQGFRIPVAVVRGGVVLLDAPGLRERLASDPAVAAVRDDPAPDATLRGADPAVRGLLRWWNDGFAAPHPEPVPAEARASAEICMGSHTLEEVLAERGATLRCNVSGYGRTHFIQGRSIVNLVLPESEGEGTWADWTDAGRDLALAQLTRACNWWSLKSGHSASFVILDHGPVPTSSEPAAPRPEDELDYIGDCMAALGFSEACGYVGVEQLNEEMRARYHGDWGWTEFILNAEGFVGTTALAYAYLGGPHTVATLGNGPLPSNELARVLAHEMGHIYQALDEYAQACSGCGTPAGYLDMPNDGCVACPNNEGRCVMRSAGEYSAEDAASMETRISPCRFTRGAVGLWDTDSDGIPDVLSTWPETRILTVLPDTLESSLNVTVAGDTWDVPFPAPPRYPEPRTINTMRGMEFSVDAGQWRGGFPVDGHFSEAREDWILYLPELGGGSHRLRVRGLNSVAHADRYPSEVRFFVHDVKLRSTILDVYAATAGFGIDWQVEGEDFGGTYHLYRRRDRGEEVKIADIASRRGRHDRHHFADPATDAGHTYQYRLEIDIEGRGTKVLATGEGLAVLPEAPEGRAISVAPNPSPRDFLFSLAVPRGPRPGSDTVVLPGTGGDGPKEAPDPRAPGDPEDPRNPFTPLWRDVRVEVFDLRGRRIRDLGIFRELESARFNLAWDTRDDAGALVPSGVYFVRMGLDYTSEVRKITLIRGAAR